MEVHAGEYPGSSLFASVKVNIANGFMMVVMATLYSDCLLNEPVRWVGAGDRESCS